MTTEEFYIRKFIREIGGFTEDHEYFRENTWITLIFVSLFNLLAVLPPMLIRNNPNNQINILESYAVVTIFLILLAIYIYINPYKGKGRLC
ncbi:hypothetical protein B0S90_0648 [Caldicellulosiruptor bescii]|jgi:hypothetical protein|uniref:Uncharacterized protein n=2 Tax=Caldicellulosiruptor bescii TaxID=31899 RepID=B9MN56_CALBD|nr:hypothetical protein [Caldicellulosiruptor bescii]ACM59512.1 hypothetical protein Athe_0377 [Caldicellulosiruptor bescii DSM 6725]PBC89544.1 hypothetical protein B0S87_2650 [Caldicellulosiruptor bescii]PBC89867.1 hypothetical protein B0S89_0152 [Caldicellulosiruptor bescii]PBD04707.1 hypothetical protein B0S85_2397 [Caldicellulosiruptor bescii]PBD05663.1 hypothetical protein B0S90_0648 [Caldicellulosiruptor bescii]